MGDYDDADDNDDDDDSDVDDDSSAAMINRIWILY